MDLNRVEYDTWGRVSKGMFLDQKVPTEKFKYDLLQIEWIDESTKDFLIDLVSGIKLYGHLNPYALILGHLSTTLENGEYTITKYLLSKAVTLLNTNTDYKGTKLSELIEKSDIIRYARLCIRLRKTYIDSVTDNMYDNQDYYSDQEDEDYDI